MHLLHTMRFSSVLGLAAITASAHAVSTGFNYGATLSDGTTPRQQSDFEAEFKRAKSLQGTDGAFTSARLYTMIQGDTTNTPTSAIQAAIDTQTTLLLGMWASLDQDGFNNELSALSSAIQQYGSAFTSLVVGISVGSEDLYRVSPTGIENHSGIGSTPQQLVSYINQVRSTIKGTGLSGASVGHVDTWTAWVNGSNDAVISACDWLGMDTYPYFQNTIDNSITTSNKTFWDAYDATAGSGGGKEVWITETGWPVSGKTENLAVPSIANAETYWQEVACALVGNYNTWWYTLQDADPTTPNPSFGIVGTNLNSAPLYDLTCKKSTGKSSGSTKKGSGKPAGAGHVVDGSHAHGPYHSNGTAAGHAKPSSGHATPASSVAASSTSGAPFQSQSGNAAHKAGAAAGAGILAIFGLVAAL